MVGPWVSPFVSGNLSELNDLIPRLDTLNIYFKKAFLANPLLLEHFKGRPTDCRKYSVGRSPGEAFPRQRSYEWLRMPYRDEERERKMESGLSDLFQYLQRKYGREPDFSSRSTSGEPFSHLQQQAPARPPELDSDAAVIDKFRRDLAAFHDEIATDTRFADWHEPSGGPPVLVEYSPEDALREPSRTPVPYGYREPEPPTQLLYSTASGQMLCRCTDAPCSNVRSEDLSTAEAHRNAAIAYLARTSNTDGT